jgi:iron complex transport system ATP-binding protein
MMPLLDVENLAVRLGEKDILTGISFTVEPGQWLMILGPNGAGKSTLIRALAQGIAYSGLIRIRDRNAAEIPRREFAQDLGVLFQSHSITYDFTVEEIVRMGGYSRAEGLFRRSEPREDFFERAIAQTGLQPLLRQSVRTLSGGELQRVFLAQLLNQNPDILVLDEPANHLDPVYQKQTFELLQQWLLHRKGAVLSVVHDLSIARRYGSQALLLSGGRQAAAGTMEEVLQPELLRDVYGMDIVQWMKTLYAQWEG